MVIGNIDGQREKGGRVLLVIGPQCSGKSTFVSHFLKTNSNFTTINRKKIIDKINMEVNETFLASILEKIEDITGKKVGSLHELNLLNLEKLNKEQKTLFLKFRGELINIVSSNTFDEFVMHAVFKAYYQEGKKYIEIEKNLILDESLINSERSFNMFKTCFENYPYIKRILIFNTLEDLFQKCLVRNDKFFELMQQTKSIDKAFEELKLKEIESGSSDSSYRSIKSIIANYRKFYEFNHDLSKKTSLTLQTLPRYKVAELFMKMAKAHCDANKKLKKIQEEPSVNKFTN